MVLVTGSTGMLGRTLCALLQKDRRPFLGLSRHGAGGSLRCDLSDETSLRKIFAENAISLVVNTAAYSDVDGCERDPKQAFEANVLACKNLSALCGEKKIPWVHLSTDYVFSGEKNQLHIEEDRTFPISIYGCTKLLGEFYALSSKSPCAVVRTSWLFGPGNPKTFVNWVSGRLKEEGSASVLDNQTTSPTSVKDLSEALVKIADSLAKKKEDQRNEVFHVCNRGGTSHKGIAEFIRDARFPKASVQKIDLSAFPNRPAIRPKYSVMDPGKFERTYGMKMRPWQESLKEYLQECAS